MVIVVVLVVAVIEWLYTVYSGRCSSERYDRGQYVLCGGDSSGDGVDSGGTVVVVLRVVAVVAA